MMTKKTLPLNIALLLIFTLFQFCDIAYAAPLKDLVKGAKGVSGDMESGDISKLFATVTDTFKYTAETDAALTGNSSNKVLKVANFVTWGSYPIVINIPNATAGNIYYYTVDVKSSAARSDTIGFYATVNTTRSVQFTTTWTRFTGICTAERDEQISFRIALAAGCD